MVNLQTYLFFNITMQRFLIILLYKVIVEHNDRKSIIILAYKTIN